MRVIILYFVYATAIICYCSARVYDGFLFAQTEKQ